MSCTDKNSERAYLYGNTFIEEPLPYYAQPPKPTPPFNQCGPIIPSQCNWCVNKPTVLPPIDRDNCRNLSYYQNPPCIPNTDCTVGEIDRNTVSNIIEVESRLKLSIDLTLYNVDAEKDIKITLENDKKYKMTYLSETGFVTIIGILKYIDINTPIECIRYISQYDNKVNPHIIMDCSSEGKSDIRIIYIKSLRYVEEIVDKPEDPDDNKDPVEDPTDNPPSENPEDPSGNPSDGEDPVEDPVDNPPSENPEDPSSNPSDGEDPIEDPIDTPPSENPDEGEDPVEDPDNSNENLS